MQILVSIGCILRTGEGAPLNMNAILSKSIKTYLNLQYEPENAEAPHHYVYNIFLLRVHSKQAVKIWSLVNPGCEG